MPGPTIVRRQQGKEATWHKKKGERVARKANAPPLVGKGKGQRPQRGAEWEGKETGRGCTSLRTYGDAGGIAASLRSEGIAEIVISKDSITRHIRNGCQKWNWAS